MIMIEFTALYSLTFKSQLFLMFECSEIQIILKSCQAKCQQEPSSPSREAYRASFMGLWPVKSHKGLHLVLLSAVAIWEFLFLNKGLDILILHCLTYYVAHPGTPVLVCVCVFFLIPFENIHQWPWEKGRNGSNLHMKTGCSSNCCCLTER